MDWKNAPIARVASIPGALDLSLEEVALLGGLWKLTQKSPEKVFCWAYFASAFGLSVSKARTRLARLEKAGLLTRRMIGERRSEATGSQITVTPRGKDLLRALAPLLAQPVKQVLSEQTSPVLSVEDTGRDVLTPKTFGEYPVVFQRAILKMDIRVARMVKRVIEAGRLIEEGEGAEVGLSLSVVGALNQAIMKYAPKAHVSSASAASCRIENEVNKGTLVPAASDDAVDDAKRSGLRLPALEEGQGGVTPIASMVVAEAVVRYRKTLCGRSPTMVANRFNEIVWSCTEGPLADFGVPVKRVRIALSLLQAGRWETPKGYDFLRASKPFKDGLSDHRSE